MKEDIKKVLITEEEIKAKEETEEAKEEAKEK